MVFKNLSRRRGVKLPLQECWGGVWLEAWRPSKEQVESDKGGQVRARTTEQTRWAGQSEHCGTHYKQGKLLLRRARPEGSPTARQSACGIQPYVFPNLGFSKSANPHS